MSMNKSSREVIIPTVFTLMTISDNIQQPCESGSIKFIAKSMFTGYYHCEVSDESSQK